MSTSTVIGNIRLDDGVGVVRMEDVYSTTATDLWEAISDPTRLSRWLGDVTGDPQLGAVLHARFTSSWEGSLRVDVCEPENHLLVSSWEEEDETPMVIEAWLTPEGQGTRLVVEERGFTRKQLPDHGAGWQAHLEDLGTYLAGDERDDWSDRWRALAPEYRAQAASLG